MKKVQVKQTWFQAIQKHYVSVRKQQSKKLLRIKIKLFLTVLLPIFILALMVQVVRTFIQIKARDIFTKTTDPSKDEHLPK